MANARGAAMQTGTARYGNTALNRTRAARLKSTDTFAASGASMRTTIEPCLCGDPQCKRCFPGSDYEYRAAMLESCLHRIRAVALDGGIPAALACREIAEIVANELQE
jgi:hypothetical protein